MTKLWSSRWVKWAEFLALYVAIPTLLFCDASRKGIYIALWGGGLYAALMLTLRRGFSWRGLWQGQGWLLKDRRVACLQFIVLAILLVILTVALVPQRFFRFPLDNFPFWCAVMLLYPTLSVVPQVLFFRSYFFTRFDDLFPTPFVGALVNGLLFGAAHLVLNNWVAPGCCAIGGVLLAHHYQRHRSMKWAVIEHALYGDWIFTIGIGWYFFTGNWRH